MRDRLAAAAAELEAAAALHRAGRMAEAAAGYQRVLAIDPANPDAFNLLGLIHHARGESETAIRLMRASISLASAGRYWYNLGLVLEARGDVPGCVSAYRQASALDPGDMAAWSAAIFAGDLHPYSTPAVRLADRRAVNARHCRPLMAASAPHTNDPDPDRRLRIGYVSADFTDHSAGMVFEPVLARHDHAAVEVVGYWQQTGPADAATTRFRTYADRWRVVNELSDEALARKIRDDGIDILVDLSGYSNGNRLLALARKPAPIIMTGWGHVTGLGLDAVDYLLADQISAPGALSHHHHERILHLPCALAFDPRPPYPEVSPSPVRATGQVTFGYLGRASKTSEPVWALWAEILHRVPGSRLVLKGREYADPAYRSRLVEFFASLRINSNRLDLRGPSDRAQQLHAYAGIDIALDAFPQTGGVTTLEACLMGVPTVTLLGDHLNGRIGASILTTLGFEQWVGKDVHQYADIAVALAADPPTLERRRAIRAALLSSIICDGRAYAAAVERVYRSAWAEWCSARVAQPAYSLAAMR